MRQPHRWECELYPRVLSALEEGGKKHSSYYLLVQESVKLCEKTQDGRRVFK